MKLKLNITKNVKELQKGLVEWVNKVVDEAYISIKAKTPEDTFALQESYQKVMASIQWNEVKGSVFTEWIDYAPAVENGINNQIFNYYKNSGRRRWWQPFYRWVWVGMFKRTYSELDDKVVSMIKEWL